MNHFSTAKKYYSYAEFSKIAEDLLAGGKTTGDNQSEKYIFYTKLNLQRMHRWNKTFHLKEEMVAQLQQLPPQTWWVITEAWCGDSAQNLPGIAQMAEASNGKIDLRIVLRDENPAIMDQYLTNGSRSIPKVVAMDENDKVLFIWGPRPAAAQTLMTDWKTNPNGRDFEAFEKELHGWYTQDKGHSLQDEIAALINAEVTI